jgi:UDP-N-acetylglucosamine 3-dehydrogenase
VSQPTVNLAFLGCGGVTQKHSETLRRFAGEVRLFYASRDRRLAEQCRQRFGGAGAFGSYDEALTSAEVDTAMVATPPDSHLELTLRALQHGKHVIVEKPAFLHSTDFAAVREAEARAGRRVLVAENYCYKPLAQVLRKLIASGALGEVRFLQLIAVKRQRVKGWRDDPRIAGGGALFEGGVHWIDLLANLGLRVESVQGFRPGSQEGPERSMLVVAQYEEGGVGTLYHSWEVPSPLRGLRLSRIYGTRASAVFESNGLFLLTRGARPGLFFPGVRDISGYQGMFRDFFEVIRTGREPVMTLARAQQGMELVEAAYRTAARNPTLEEVT